MSNRNHRGKLLVANPCNPQDELDKAVLVIITHTDTSSICLQINNVLEDISFTDVVRNLGFNYKGYDPVYFGGNIDQNKIHVLHSLDWKGLSTVAINDEVGITNDLSVIAALSQGVGPIHFKACSGYWLWENKRLDLQLSIDADLSEEPHRWELAPADVKTVFEVNSEELWGYSIKYSARHRIAEWF